MVVGKYGLLARKCSLKDADNGRVNILTFPHAPTHSALTAVSHCSACQKSLTSVLESFKTESFKLSDTSSGRLQRARYSVYNRQTMYA